MHLNASSWCFYQIHTLQCSSWICFSNWLNYFIVFFVNYNCKEANKFSLDTIPELNIAKHVFFRYSRKWDVKFISHLWKRPAFMVFITSSPFLPQAIFHESKEIAITAVFFQLWQIMYNGSTEEIKTLKVCMNYSTNIRVIAHPYSIWRAWFKIV